MLGRSVSSTDSELCRRLPIKPGYNTIRHNKLPVTWSSAHSVSHTHSNNEIYTHFAHFTQSSLESCKLVDWKMIQTQQPVFIQLCQPMYRLTAGSKTAFPRASLHYPLQSFPFNSNSRHSVLSIYCLKRMREFDTLA